MPDLSRLAIVALSSASLGACGVLREAEIKQKGYSAFYNKQKNYFAVTLTADEVERLSRGSPSVTDSVCDSSQSRASAPAVTNRVIEIIEKEGYCGSAGAVITSRGSYSGRWDFGGHCQ